METEKVARTCLLGPRLFIGPRRKNRRPKKQVCATSFEGDDFSGLAPALDGPGPLPD
jgi:hypothetical protein